MIRRLYLMMFVWLIASCDSARELNEFSLEEKLDLGKRFQYALTNDQPKILDGFVGFSRIRDTVVTFLKTEGVNDYQLGTSGLNSISFYNDGFRVLLNRMAYEVSLQGDMEFLDYEESKNQFRMRFSYRTSWGFFEVCEIDLITNGYQLLISDFFLLSKERSLSETMFMLGANPGYFSAIASAEQDLRYAGSAIDNENIERAEYFINKVPIEYMSEPFLTEVALETLSKLELNQALQLLERKISEAENPGAKAYWNMRKAIASEVEKDVDAHLNELIDIFGPSEVIKSSIEQAVSGFK